MKNRQAMLLTVALMLLLAAAVPVAAQTGEPPYRLFLPAVLREFPAQYTLTASADAFVFEAGPNTNTGSDPALYIGNDQDEGSRLGILRSFVRFELPATSSYQVAKATLRLYYAGYADFPNTNRTLRILASNGPWQENTVTWANQPPEGSYIYVTPINSSQPFGYLEFDVTNRVRWWADGGGPNYGFMLLGPENADEDWSYRVFAARESDYPPQLVIDTVLP